MQRASILASVMGLTLVAPAMAQNATGGGASGGGGGGAIVESPQAGQTKMPAGTSSNTPGMGMATLSARPRQSVKPATYPNSASRTHYRHGRTSAEWHPPGRGGHR